MRTTLAIDDDVLMAAKGLAEHQQKSLGEVISSLVRQALRSDAPITATRNGIPLLRHSGAVTPVTLALVNQLRDESP